MSNIYNGLMMVYTLIRELFHSSKDVQSMRTVNHALSQHYKGNFNVSVTFFKANSCYLSS